jgi:hypothetical protein
MDSFAGFLKGMLDISLDELNASEKKDISNIQVTGDDSERMD